MPGMFGDSSKKVSKPAAKKRAVAGKAKEMKQVKSVLNTTKKKIERVKKFINKVL